MFHVFDVFAAGVPSSEPASPPSLVEPSPEALSLPVASLALTTEPASRAVALPAYIPVYRFAVTLALVDSTLNSG